MTATGENGSAVLVTPQWLEAHKDHVRLIEIAGLRQDEMQAYRAGHVPGAICWKWKEKLWDSHMRDFPDPATFAALMGGAGIRNDMTVVLYGEDVQFGIYAWWVLRYCGHENVRLLDGARYRWQAEGRPLETEIPTPPAPVAYNPAARKEEMRVHRDGVLALLGKEDVRIFDARSAEEYRGERVGGPGGADVGAMRYGRIPGARHVYYMDLLDETKSFKSPDALKTLFDSKGLTRDSQVITYCRLSHRATVAYFALTQLLGHKNVRVYDGSWTEWGNLVGVPVER